MKATFTIAQADIDRLNNALRRKSVELGQDLRQVVKDESRLFIRDAINFTRPKVKGNNWFQRIAPTEQQRVGLRAIEKDVGRQLKAFRSVVSLFERLAAGGSKVGKSKDSTIRNYKRVLDFIKLYSGQKRLRAIQTILKDFKIKTEPVTQVTEELFREYERRNKGERKPTALLVLDEKSADRTRRAVIKKKAEKLGIAKSGWKRAALALGLGGRLPRWISRHNASGSVEINDSTINPSVTMINAVRYAIGDAPDIIGKAFRKRAYSIEARLKAIAEKRTKGF